MIPLDRSTDLKFSLSIKNTNKELERASLVIEGKGYEISVPISMGKEDAHVTIPVLENVILPGSHKIRIEMILGGVLYTPFSESMEFILPPSIKVESMSDVEANISEVKIIGSQEIKCSIVEETLPEEDNSYKSQFVKLLEEAFRNKKK